MEEVTKLDQGVAEQIRKKRYDESICPVVEVLCERYLMPESGSGNSDFFDFHGRTW